MPTNNVKNGHFFDSMDREQARSKLSLLLVTIYSPVANLIFQLTFGLAE